MSRDRLIRLRLKAFDAQGGCCFYCGIAMWEATRESRGKASLRLGYSSWRSGHARKRLNRRRCTAEHLVRQSEGGTDVAGNVVAACRDCNSWRGLAPVPLWVQQRGARA